MLGEFIGEVLWRGVDVWLHARILGRSGLWLVFLGSGACATWTFSGGNFVLGFIFAAIALAVLAPAWFSED